MKREVVVRAYDGKWAIVGIAIEPFGKPQRRRYWSESGWVELRDEALLFETSRTAREFLASNRDRLRSLLGKALE